MTNSSYSPLTSWSHLKSAKISDCEYKVGDIAATARLGNNAAVGSGLRCGPAHDWRGTQHPHPAAALTHEVTDYSYNLSAYLSLSPKQTPPLVAAG